MQIFDFISDRAGDVGEEEEYAFSRNTAITDRGMFASVLLSKHPLPNEHMWQSTDMTIGLFPDIDYREEPEDFTTEFLMEKLRQRG